MHVKSSVLCLLATVLSLGVTNIQATTVEISTDAVTATAAPVGTITAAPGGPSTTAAPGVGHHTTAHGGATAASGPTTAARAAATTIAANALGGACTANNCTDAHAECKDSKCACVQGYTQHDGNTCSQIDANKVGGACTHNATSAQGSCSDHNAVCSASPNSFCACTQGFTGTPGGACSSAAGLTSIASLVLALFFSAKFFSG